MNQYSTDSIVAGGSISVEDLVSEALSLVLTDRGETRAQCYLNTIHRLALAFIDDDPDKRREAVSDVMAGGTSAQDFMTVYAADTARYLGDLWGKNSISFVDVTIGTARIQETVRSISARQNRGDAPSRAPRIFLAAPQREDHLLGVFLARESFRSLGCSVKLAIGLTDRDVTTMAVAQPYNMIGISISSARTINAARDLIKSMRASLCTNVPIVIGGCRVMMPDLLSETGADHAISDPREALAVCNIAVKDTASI